LKGGAEARGTSPSSSPRSRRGEQIGAGPLYIKPGSPWKSGYDASFNGSLRDELLNGEIFCSHAEAKVLIGAWRRHYAIVRPHSSLGYRSPAPEDSEAAVAGRWSRFAPPLQWRRSRQCTNFGWDHSLGAARCT
jgi:transposase InsO family protein